MSFLRNLFSPKAHGTAYGADPKSAQTNLSEIDFKLMLAASVYEACDRWETEELAIAYLLSEYQSLNKSSLAFLDHVFINAWTLKRAHPLNYAEGRAIALSARERIERKYGLQRAES